MIFDPWEDFCSSIEVDDIPSERSGLHVRPALELIDADKCSCRTVGIPEGTCSGGYMRWTPELPVFQIGGAS